MADLLSSLVSNPPPPLVGPNYNIYRFTDQIYKIVHFKSPKVYCMVDSKPRKKSEPSEKNLIQVFLGRVVLSWNWQFVTIGSIFVPSLWMKQSMIVIIC